MKQANTEALLHAKEHIYIVRHKSFLLWENSFKLCISEISNSRSDEGTKDYAAYPRTNFKFLLFSLHA